MPQGFFQKVHLVSLPSQETYFSADACTQFHFIVTVRCFTCKSKTKHIMKSTGRWYQMYSYY